MRELKYTYALNHQPCKLYFWFFYFSSSLLLRRKKKGLKKRQKGEEEAKPDCIGKLQLQRLCLVGV